MAQERDRLTDAEREELTAIREATTLSELSAVVGASTEHAAYVRAKRRWRRLRTEELVDPPTEGFPGDEVTIGDVQFVVHGITHADTETERAFLREWVGNLDEEVSVYCEQGIRPMYFADIEHVYEMDDYRWAVEMCRKIDLDSHVSAPEEFEGIEEDVRSLAETFREATFALIDSGSEVYGTEFTRVLGDLASDFLMTHEQQATGEDFEAFRLSRAAAEDPSKLGELQYYYRRAFLPQPLEREWLRRHDPELELMTHARNERIADYAVAHCSERDVLQCDDDTVHLVVGAAHQPGVTYYLEQHRDDKRSVAGFELVE